MNCLDNVIGIRGCGSVESSSGLYVQDLPGISLREANAAADQETISGFELIKEKITFAQSAILSQMRNLLSDTMKVNSLIESDNVGHYKENLKVVAPESGYLKGIKLKIDQNQYTEITISRLSLKVNYIGEVPVYVYDLMSNTLLDIFQVEVNHGEVSTIVVNKTYKTNRQILSLFICYDASIPGYESSVSKPSGCYSCENEYLNRYVKFYSGKIDSSNQKIDSNVKSSSGTAGLSFEYSIACSLESFLCSLSGLIAMPLLYKIGIELLTELIYSKRLNSIVLLNKQDFKELRTEFESKYQSSMEDLVQNIKLPKDICFGCNYKVRKTVQIP